MATVVITGASRGLGLALAREFSARGHRVFAGTRAPVDMGDAIERFELNVRDEHQVDAAINAIAQRSPIDILVNNAGIYIGGPLAEIAQDDFKHVLDVNLLGAWRVSRAVLRHMRKGGCIGMISSLSGLVGRAEDGAYTASKFALEGMSQSLACELASRGIRVALFEPGGIATEFTESTDGAPPAEIAREIVDKLTSEQTDLHFPVGDQARQITGRLRLDTRMPDERLKG